MALDFRQNFGDAYKAKKFGERSQGKYESAVGSLGGRTSGIGSQYQQMAQNFGAPSQYQQMALGAMPEEKAAMRQATTDAGSRYKSALGTATRAAANRGLTLSPAQLTKLAIAGASAQTAAGTRAAAQARADRFRALQQLSNAEMQRGRMQMGAVDRASQLARWEDDMAGRRAGEYERMATEGGEFYGNRENPYEYDPYGRVPQRTALGGPAVYRDDVPRGEALPDTTSVGVDERRSPSGSLPDETSVDYDQAPSTARNRSILPERSERRGNIRRSDIHRGREGRIGGMGSLSGILGKNEYRDQSGFVLGKDGPVTKAKQDWVDARTRKDAREGIGDFERPAKQPYREGRKAIDEFPETGQDPYEKYGTPLEQRRRKALEEGDEFQQEMLTDPKELKRRTRKARERKTAESMGLKEDFKNLVDDNEVNSFFKT